MWWFVGIGAYAFFFVVVLAFLRGASARECPEAQPIVVNFPEVASLPFTYQMESETVVASMAIDPRHRNVWETDTSYSLAP
jgi:hypothetical protein